MSRGIKRRIARLATGAPSSIRLYGADGRVLYEYFGDGNIPRVGLDCYLGLVERIESGDPNILRIMRECVSSSENFGRLWELLKAIAAGVEEDFAICN